MKALALPSPTSFSRLTPMTWFGILMVITCALALALPPDPAALARLHITSQDYRIAVLTLLVPYIICWYAGFYVFAKLSEYTPYLKKSIEGEAFAKTTRGMGILAFSLVIPTIANLLLGQLAQRHHAYVGPVTVINNYISLFFPLVAVLFISAGSRMLAGITKSRPNFTGTQIFAAIFIILSTSYSFLVSHNYYRFHNPYHLHIFVLIVTYIAPYLYLWFMGLLSAYDFRLYSINIKGILYKQALNLLSGGLALAMFGSIIGQFISGSLGARQSSIGWALLLNYITILIVGGGLVMMALGAKRLKKIEEV